MATEKSYIDMLKERDVITEALKEHLAIAHEKIAELEKEKAEYVPVLAWIARECNQVDGGMLYRLKSYLAIRDLEQQAKGIEDFVEPYVKHGKSVYEHGLRRAIALRNQAKALKEQE
jgi:hypothetical protein